MSKPPESYQSRQVLKEFVKRFGDANALKEETATSEDRSYRIYLTISSRLSMTLPLLRRLCVHGEAAKHMQAVTT